MSLPPGQQRVLEKIEGRLAQSDPRLTSLFTIFTRLTWTEKMPWIEQIRFRPVKDRLVRVGHALWGARRRRGRRVRVRGMLLLPAALTAVACALTIAFGFPGSQRPAPRAKTPAPRELVLKSRQAFGNTARQCRAIVRMPVLIRTPALSC